MTKYKEFKEFTFQNDGEGHLMFPISTEFHVSSI